MTSLSDALEALLKYGIGSDAVHTERYMALTLCRFSSRPVFRVYNVDRPFFESRCLPALLRSPDPSTQKFAFLSLVNIVQSADNLSELMEKENFVSLLLVYLQSRDRSTQWLCMASLVLLLRCGQVSVTLCVRCHPCRASNVPLPLPLPLYM